MLRLPLILAVALTLLSACTSISKQGFPLADPSNISSGHALIIIERKLENNGSFHEVEVTDNGETVGELGVGIGNKGNRKYHQLVWQRPEGNMTLRLTPSYLVGDDEVITTYTRAGRVYRFEVAHHYALFSSGLRLKEVF